MRYRPTMHAVRPRSRAIPQLPRSIWQTCCNHTRKALTCKSQESISHGGQRWMRERSHGAWRQIIERADRVPCNPSHSRKHQRTTAPSPRRVALGSEPPLCCCAPRNKPTGPRTRLTRATDEATTKPSPNFWAASSSRCQIETGLGGTWLFKLGHCGLGVAVRTNVWLLPMMQLRVFLFHHPSLPLSGGKKLDHEADQRRHSRNLLMCKKKKNDSLGKDYISCAAELDTQSGAP